MQTKANGHEVLKGLENEDTRLAQYMETLVWPKLTCFHAFGQTYKLPFRSRAAGNRKSPTSAQLEYLGGFFDGDGCVACKSDLTACWLSMGQVAINAEVLVLFVEFFGGCIYRQANGQGIRQPKLQWQVHCQEARAAAKQLSSVCLGKREQLDLVSNWWDNKDERQLVADQLREQKKRPPTIPSELSLSWPYLAGLSDSAGCIKLRPNQNSKAVKLEITQKYKALLLLSKAFLDRQFEESGAEIYSCTKSAFRLEITDQKTVRTLLQELLKAGLMIKASTARCALAPHRNHASMREQLSATITGNQGRYTRLDAQGCQRSKSIKSLRSKMRADQRKHDSKSVEQLENQLATLQLHHDIENAKCRIRRRKEDIKMLLAAGATSSKPSPASVVDLDHDLVSSEKNESAPIVVCHRIIRPRLAEHLFNVSNRRIN